jgi:hypothetical protein
MDTEKPVAHWRIILAGIFDFITAFFVLGFVIAFFSGGLTDTGFQLTGLPALILFVLMFVYFWAGKKFFGGTIWKRVFKVR